MIEEIRNIEISTLRNNGSIDISWDEFHYSGKVYGRYLNLDNAMVRHFLALVTSGNSEFNKQFAKENRELLKELVEQEK